MTNHATDTPSNRPGYRRLWTRIKWPVFIGLALAAMFLTGIFARGGEAATSPTLGAADSLSVLAATTVTCTGTTTVEGDVGVSAGTAIDGFPSPCTAGPPGSTHANDADAIAAQADNLILFGALDADDNADANCIGGILPDGTDLTLLSPLEPGLYCSGGSFLLTGNLTLSGSGVWVFKTASALITSPGSSVTGGDPCGVWWRIGSSATLDTTTSFVGNILALTSIFLENGATLNGRALAQTGEVTMDSNTISTEACSAVVSTPVPATSTPSSTPDDSFTAATSKPAATSTPASSTPTAIATQGTPSIGRRPPQSPISPPQTGDGGLLLSTTDDEL